MLSKIGDRNRHRYSGGGGWSADIDATAKISDITFFTSGHRAFDELDSLHVLKIPDPRVEAAERPIKIMGADARARLGDGKTAIPPLGLPAASPAMRENASKFPIAS